jgi:D-alanine-D-alanine ligase
MRVVLLHDEIGAAAAPDDRDVYTQMEAIERALGDLGHGSERLAFTLNAQAAAARLRELEPELVFNLVESVGGQGRLIHVAPALLDSMGLAYTGCRTDAIYATSNKLLAKRLLRGMGIPTPDWVELGGSPRTAPRPVRDGDDRWIVKSVWEHASRGLDEGSVLEARDPASLREMIAQRLDSLGGEGFAERYIHGREFNLSILDGRVLAAAEVLFDGYAPGRPRVVGYRAKWEEGSFEYTHTPRRFEFDRNDADLLAEVRLLAERCWSLFGLRGYARVDFRVDDAGRPWVLEINSNPCLSPDAGFAAALARSGIEFRDAIVAILEASVPRLQGGSGPRRELATAAVPGNRPGWRGTLREMPRADDAEAVRDIVASTGFFHDFEVEVAVELVQERLARGAASGYFFLFAEDESGRVAGYACFGPIACTAGGFDLYWIAVHRDWQARGLGRQLVSEVERRIAAGVPSASRPGELVRGTLIYAETSSQPRYAPTRRFYATCGYQQEATFRDFYAPGDDKVVFVKPVGGS